MPAAEVTAIEVEMPVPGPHTWTDCHDVEFTVERVIHRAQLYQDRYMRTITLFGTTSAGELSNASLHTDDVPDWVPTAPRGWHDVATTIVSKAVR